MEEGLAFIYSGDYNDLNFYHQADGTDIVEIVAVNGEKYRMHIRGLWSESEKVLSHEKVDTSIPEYILSRIAAARQIREEGKHNVEI